MHSFLRTIGFSKEDTKEVLTQLVNTTLDSQLSSLKKLEGKNDSFEIFKYINDSFGIVIHGEIDENNNIEISYVFPFAKPENYVEYNEINIEMNVYNTSFSAACDEINIGVSLIFYLQNGLDYVNYISKHDKIESHVKVGLVGMSLSGTIIMPVKKNVDLDKSINKIKRNRSLLINKAKNGDEEAMESLTIEEMNIYTRINERVKNEDVFSVVDTSFMPYGIQCDRYSIIGEIVSIHDDVNCYSGDKVYIMSLNCNDVVITTLINKNDLVGEPMIGRRFKGNIWMQGKVLMEA